jgi:hypothetical protein
MLSVELSIGDFDGQAVVALRGEPDLADTPSIASHLIAGRGDMIWAGYWV